MVWEIISLALGITTGVAAGAAWLYKKGQAAGIDKACGKRIEKKIDEMQIDGDKVHNELKKEVKDVKKEVHEINKKLNTLNGSFETFKDIVKERL